MFKLVPFRKRSSHLDEFKKDFNRILASFFQNDNNNRDNDQKQTQSIDKRTHLKDKENKYVLEIELPGINKENITVEVEGKEQLLISVTPTEDLEEENLKRINSREPNFERKFRLNKINTEEIEAEYHEGLLLIHLPKIKENKSENKTIDIN